MAKRKRAKNKARPKIIRRSTVVAFVAGAILL